MQRIMVAMSAALTHLGHVRGGRPGHVVGVLTADDEILLRRKDQPALRDDERCEVLAACKASS